MATLKILDSNCEAEKCSARATREVMTTAGGAEKSAGFFCARHAEQRLKELTKEEWNAARKGR